MTNIPAGLGFLKDPPDWIAPDGVSCFCRSVGVGVVHDVHPGEALAVAGTGGGLPGLTAEETAILAGVLVGLATFLFLLLPILCCLCPIPCAICGKKGAAAAAGKHGHANLVRKGSDAESFWSKGSWGAQDKMDYENLYGVDMKLPRPWYDSQRGANFDSKLRGLENDGWEGVDMTRDEIDVAARAGGGGGETVAQTGLVTYAAQEQGGSSMGNGHYSTVDRSRSGGGGAGGEEVITEYATTRRLDISVGGMSQDEAEKYYTKEYQDSDLTKDNFMRLYWSYRNKLEGKE